MSWWPNNKIKMNEIVEVLTEDGKRTGKTIEKSLAHKKEICHGISAVGLINNKGRLLIQKRSKTKKVEPDIWDLSGTGHIDVGETPEKAAIRELEEELGIVVNEDELLLIGTYLNKITLTEEVNLNHYTYLFIVKKDIEINEIKKEKKEVSDVVYVDKKQFIKMVKDNLFVKAIIKCGIITKYMK